MSVRRHVPALLLPVLCLLVSAVSLFGQSEAATESRLTDKSQGRPWRDVEVQAVGQNRNVSPEQTTNESLPLASQGTEAGLVAQYHLDEGSGTAIRDSSGNKQDGAVVGGAEWVPGIGSNAILFNGLNRITIPSSQLLNAMRQVTVTAWIKGHGGKFRLVREPTSFSSVRGPHFQVCGDVLRFASNADRPNALLTGSADVNLSNWKDEQRTKAPLSAVEPKLQVSGNRIYYEYFGRDAGGASQIWSAQSNIDGSDYRAVPLTHEKEDSSVEQGGFQVVGSEIYYGWPKKDKRKAWQLWTASSQINGSRFEATQRTNAGRAFVNQQVVGNKIYYLTSIFWGKPSDPGRNFYLDNMEIAVSAKHGGALRVLRTFKRVKGVQFKVSNGTIYLSYVQVDEHDQAHLFTGRMKTDGSSFHVLDRDLGNGSPGIPSVRQFGIQVVGDKVYYALAQIKTNKKATDAFKHLSEWSTPGNNGYAVWTAEASIDDSQWKAIQRTASPPDIMPQYKSIDVIGGKIYYSLAEAREYREPYEPFYAYLATSGSNIVNKGDAYGLALTERNEARAFVNAGEDYLFRAEAPEDTAGAIADFAVDQEWHFIGMTYDESSVKLYVDGALRSSMPYHSKVGNNPFPLVIGDGFVGLIDEVSIYNRRFRDYEIRTAYQAFKTSYRLP